MNVSVMRTPGGALGGRISLIANRNSQRVLAVVSTLTDAYLFATRCRSGCIFEAGSFVAVIAATFGSTPS